MPPSPKTTPFRLRVWAACALVPSGSVTTYGVIAKALETSPRAVGQALKANPYAPCVPCHRVVASDGGLHGFFGHTEGEHMNRKATLLKQECVIVDVKTGKVDPACLLK